MSPVKNFVANDSSWIFPEPLVPTPELIVAAGGSELLARLLAQRGYRDPEAARVFLDFKAYQPASAYDLRDMDVAVKRLSRAVRNGERILVWGDFDVDGQTATTVLVQGLRQLGGNIVYYIPHRERESHGVSLPSLERFLDGGVQLVLTCDTGIAAVDAARRCAERGVDFLVTDHHDLPAELPDALTLINPKFLPAEHALSTLPGVGVVYKVMEALFEAFGRAGDEKQFLDLVALGIVADLAVLFGDTRYLLQRGLQALRQTNRQGLLNLFELAELDAVHLTEEHIGFVIGPRLNALGRLDDANLAVEFLTTPNSGQARILATTLEGLNAQRKLLTDQVFKGALSQIEKDPGLLKHAVVVLANPEWPAGVIGIVASRIVERFHKPAILFSAPQGGRARGSARSIAGVNITAAIAANQELLIGFGGHPMAAGLALETERIPEFRRAISRTVETMLKEVHREPALMVDAELHLGELTLDLVNTLDRLGPFGSGNPALVFASQPIKIRSSTAIGRDREHLQLVVEDNRENIFRVLWWQGAGWEMPRDYFQLAYTARSSSYQARSGVQIEWVDARPIAEKPGELPNRVARRFVDFRGSPDPLQKFREHKELTDSVVWVEGMQTNLPHTCHRLQLHKAETLVILTAPPGQVEFLAGLEQVNPAQVILLGLDAGLDAPQSFLHRLAGMVKHTIRARNGMANLEELAAVMGHRPVTIRMGLAWMQARGLLTLVELENYQIQICAAEQAAVEAPVLLEQLQHLLDETRAYRAYFRQASLETFTDL
jgi:single-stranded-DNA-specific exonuclease